MGKGAQYWPWISLTDEIGAMRHLLTADVSGAVNLTGPAPATNAEFTRELARQVHRPAVLPVPGVAIKLALGEFGRNSILAGQRAMPTRLEASGYRFAHPDLASALQSALRRS
jgi:NAD dependent epimerase/dehydratase family enzyme